MVADMRATGSIIKCMVKEFLSGTMVELTLVTMSLDKKADLENLLGLINELTEASGQMVCKMEKEFMLHPVVKKKQESGKMVSG
jgi:hypothetical protein